jgi:hypothetical protein
MKHLNKKKVMQKDHKHVLVIEVEVEVGLVEFDEIRTWREKFDLLSL